MLKRAISALLTLLVAVSCNGTYDIEDNEPCRNVGYSIASRTFSCSNNSALANDRYERFSDQFRCVVRDVRAGDFTCAVEVNKLPCEAVASAADNFDLWLQASADCARILVHADGTSVSGPNNAGADGAADVLVDVPADLLVETATEAGGEP